MSHLAAHAMTSLHAVVRLHRRADTRSDTAAGLFSDILRLTNFRTKTKRQCDAAEVITVAADVDDNDIRV